MTLLLPKGNYCLKTIRMRNLIIGAAGFVGGYLIETLQKDGEEVYATKLPVEQVTGNAEFLDLDITDKSQLVTVLNSIQPDVIYHLAAQSSVKLSWVKPQLTVDVNIKGAVNLFEAARQVCSQSKIIVIGSSEEYGEIGYERAVSEEVEPNPKNIYALSKYTQEKLAEIYVKAYGLNIVCTRSFNHFGPGQASAFVVADFCSQVAKIEKGEQAPVIRVGNLNAYRDFTDVRDVVGAYKFLAWRGLSGNVYNVGSGKALQIKEILDIILSMTDTAIEVVTDETKYRPIDIPVIKADISKIKGLGWQPSIPLKETILNTLNYFREIK